MVELTMVFPITLYVLSSAWIFGLLPFENTAIADFFLLERTIGLLERPYAILQQWGEHRDEVKFYLRYPPPPGAPTQAGSEEKEEKQGPSGEENDGLCYGFLTDEPRHEKTCLQDLRPG